MLINVCLQDHKHVVSHNRFMGVVVFSIPRMWSCYCKFITDFPGLGFLVVKSLVSSYCQCDLISDISEKELCLKCQFSS